MSNQTIHSELFVAWQRMSLEIVFDDQNISNGVIATGLACLSAGQVAMGRTPQL